MYVYYFEFILIGLLWIISIFIKEKKFNRLIKIFAFGSLLFLTCFRSPNIDPDTPMYINYFKMFHNMSWSEVINFTSIEVGDCILFKFIGEVWFDERFFIVVMSLITIIPVFIFINKKSKNVYLSLLIFMTFDFWFGTMYIMRQYTALSLCLISLIFIDKKTRFALPWFSFWVLIACFFHYSAVFFIPVFFLKYFKPNIRFAFAILILFAIFMLFNQQIVGFMSKYARISYDVTYTGGSNLLILLIAIVILVPILNHSILKDKEFSFYYMMFVYSTLIQSLSIAMENMTRAARFSMIAMMIVIPNFLHDYLDKESNRQFKPIVNFGLFTLLAVFFILSIGNHSISGYSFIWS